MRIACLALLIPAVCLAAEEGLALHGKSQFSGMADASAAVAVSSNLFLAASDEDNILRLYRVDHPGGPLKTWNLDGFLRISKKSPETDLEGGALIGNRAFWIGSHGRNAEGKARPNRHRFFATDITITNGEVAVTPVGKPYTRLLADFLKDRRLNRFHLATAAKLAPKEEDALNLEGLAATPQGHLLIGFRNPVPKGGALVVPLLNPNEVINGKTAMLGAPIQVDLGGLGIRDMAFHDGAYVVIAGFRDSGGPFGFYRWAGPGTPALALSVLGLADYNPEAIIIYPQRGFDEIQILSDDGARKINGVHAKDLPDPAQRTFRSFWLTLPQQTSSSAN